MEKSSDKYKWIISPLELYDGALLTLKNTERLLKDALITFENKRYSISIVISILAFEEFGKHIMIADRAQKKIPITDKEWVNDFSDHRTKLHALKRMIETMKPSTGLEDEQSRELNELTDLVNKWGKRKLEGIYLDWNSKTKSWYSYDEENENTKEKEAKHTVELIKWFFDVYNNARGHMPFYTQKQVNKLFNEGKIHFRCRDCDRFMIIETELIKHNKQYPTHSVGLYDN